MSLPDLPCSNVDTTGHAATLQLSLSLRKLRLYLTQRSPEVAGLGNISGSSDLTMCRLPIAFQMLSGTATRTYHVCLRFCR